MNLMKTHILRNIRTLYVIIGIIIFLMVTSYLWNYTVDDAYIPFRFASHLAQGQGLVWNLGDIPVEGYSNFLWVLLITLAFIFKIDPIIFTRIINSIFLIGIIAIFWNLSKDFFSDDLQSAYLCFSIGVLILLSNPATAIHFLSGLETLTYSFFILLTTFIAFKMINGEYNKLMWAFSLSGVLTGLLRPEGFLITMGLFLLVLAFFKKYRNEGITNLLKSFVMFFFIPILLYMIFRLIYFNEIFPMPFLVKTMTYGGFFNLAINFSVYYIIPIILVILPAVYYAKNKFDISAKTFSLETKYLLYILIILVTAICANIIYVNMSLIMNYAQRFLYPTLVLLYILSAISITLIKRNINYKLTNIRFSKAIEIVLVVLLIFSNLYFLPQIAYTQNYSTDLNEVHIPLGKALEQHSDYNYTVVCMDVGAISYYSKWKNIDLDGLTDVYIAKNHGVSSEYLIKKNPELVILVSADGINVDFSYSSHDQKVVYNYVKQNNYIQLTSIKFNRNYYLIPYLNPKIEHYDKIANTLNELANKTRNPKNE